MGIVDSASFKKPVINIGNRQTGKIFPKNIIQTKNNMVDILKSIKLSQSSQFKKNLKNLKNPYAPISYNLSKFLKNLLKLKKNNIYKKKFIDKII